jgi:hypothetical protein
MDGSEAVAQNILSVNGIDFVNILRKVPLRRIIAENIFDNIPGSSAVVQHAELKAVQTLSVVRLCHERVLGSRCLIDTVPNVAARRCQYLRRPLFDKLT